MFYTRKCWHAYLMKLLIVAVLALSSTESKLFVPLPINWALMSGLVLSRFSCSSFHLRRCSQRTNWELSLFGGHLQCWDPTVSCWVRCLTSINSEIGSEWTDRFHHWYNLFQLIMHGTATSFSSMHLQRASHCTLPIGRALVLFRQVLTRTFTVLLMTSFLPCWAAVWGS